MGAHRRLEAVRSKDSRVYLIKSEDDLNRLYDDIERELIHGAIEVEWGEYVPKRSLAQNRLMWAFYTDIAKQCGHTAKDMHLYLRSEFLVPVLKTICGKVFYELPSTTDLSIKDMAEYLKNIEAHALINGYWLRTPHYRDFAINGE